MRQTLFLIPHWLFQGPLLIAWVLFGVVALIVLARKHGWKAETWNFIPVWLAGAAALYLVVPQIEIPRINPDDPLGPPIPGGLAIRGYGLFMMLGLIVGIGMSMWRAGRQGINPDRILTLAFTMVICGIVGARLFYVIQKREDFLIGSPIEIVGRMIDMTKGGLVVYGSLIGATVGGGVYLWRSRLPVLRVADIVAPGMVAGLALGRLGCLMNGCCFGGLCDTPTLAQSFPAGSPPYLQQMYDGSLFGIESTDSPSPAESVTPRPEGEWRLVRAVAPESAAAEWGLETGDWFRIVPPPLPMETAEYLRTEHFRFPTGASIAIETPAGVRRVPISETPAWSQGIYPTQILAAVNATLLSLLLWWYFPVRRYEGRVFALMLVLYAVSRFLLEFVRTDEAGVFGTPFTISQWVSFVMLAGGLALFATGRQRVP